MKYIPVPSADLKRERGQTIVVVAGALFILLAISALAVDMGYYYVVRAQLQNAADAAALAATGYIGHKYETLTWEQQQNWAFTRSEIVVEAQKVGYKNVAGGKNITINDADVVIGKWDSENHVLIDVDDLNHPTAVRVTARRDESANGPVATFFARVVNVDSLPEARIATAALTGESTADAGSIYIPVGISRQWFEANSCNQTIQFQPTGTLTGCAGWTAWSDQVNDATLRTLIENLIPPNATAQSPEVIAGQTEFNFTGGTMSKQTYDAFVLLYNAMKGLGGGGTYPCVSPTDPRDADCDPNKWTTRVLVYDKDDCSNPNETMKIAGFSTIEIYQVLLPPYKEINARVLCDFIAPGRGGGGDYWTAGSIPNLVQ